jgi:anaerobic magnesium-protoporphyrin IX monomethyl ester cyclase
LSKDIVLVVPISRSHYVVPPLGLGYLAASLRKVGFDSIEILDCVKENLSFTDLAAAIKSLKPRVVGFQLFSSDFASVKKGVRLVKEVAPQAVALVGGPHVSATGTSVLADMPEADYAFVGEAEIGLPLFMQRLLGGEKIAQEDIPGLVWRGADGPMANQRSYVTDLDSLGFPAWDLMPPNTYPDAPQGAFYKQFPIAPMATSRGCPYSCAFCGSPVNMGKKIRFRGLSNVFAEMELLRENYGVREFHFVDDMFNLSGTRVKQFCQILDSKGWGVTYTFPNGLRLNTLDQEMLSCLKKTGVYGFTVGIESGSQRILDAMNKELTVDMIREKVNLVKNAGLEPSGFFLLGFPGETREDMEMTLQLAKNLPLSRAHFSNFLPLPGTEATRKLIESGEIEPPDWNELAYSKAPYAPHGITKKELKAFQRRAFLEFHLRPRILFKILRDVKSPFHFWSIFKRARDYLFWS